jgi:surface polysaccharide O-acyltransferase-like enzyme
VAEAMAGRRDDVDALRGLAVLLMVMVHLAATVQPVDASPTSALAYVVAGLGGLAAPLFVVLAGWSAAGRPRPFSARARRSGVLVACQMAVNLSAPHLYDPWTPGVLSLFALLTLLPLRSDRAGVQRLTRWTGAVVSLVVVLLVPAWQGPSMWTARVSVTSLSELLHHLMLTGLYPLLPWLLLALLGVQLREVAGPVRLRVNVALVALGLASSAVALALSLSSDRTWAAPTSPDGEALLVFFPANTLFLLAAMAGVLLLWATGPLLARAPGLASLGQCSLTVYVAHTPLLWWLHTIEPSRGWTGLMATGIVLLGTLMWWPICSKLADHARTYTLEGMMRRIS